jgi:hypothetical protein
MTTPALRKWVLGIALTVTLVAAIFAPPVTDSDDILPSPHVNETSRSSAREDRRAVLNESMSKSATRQDIEVLAIKPRIMPDQMKTVFRVASRTSGTTGIKETELVSDLAEVIPPAPPPVPEAPPLPFKFLGRYIEGGKERVFLQFKDESLVVAVGDSVAEDYQVDSLLDGVLTLLYVPLQQKQTLQIGAIN